MTETVMTVDCNPPFDFFNKINYSKYNTNSI